MHVLDQIATARFWRGERTGSARFTLFVKTDDADGLAMLGGLDRVVMSPALDVFDGLVEHRPSYFMQLCKIFPCGLEIPSSTRTVIAGGDDSDHDRSLCHLNPRSCRDAELTMGF
jgi:hypothetical protein